MTATGSDRLRRLPIAAITLAGFHRGLRLSSAILRKRASDVVGFVEAAFLVAPNKPLVGLVGLDAFPLTGHVRRNGDTVPAVAEMVARSRIAPFGQSSDARSAERALNQMLDHDVPQAYRQLAIDRLTAFYRYDPPIYDGRVLLFWAPCRPLFHSLGPTLGWERYAARGFSRIALRGNHDNILQLPHAGAVATALDAAIDRAIDE